MTMGEISTSAGIRFRRLGGFSPTKNPDGNDLDQPAIWYLTECLSCSVIVLDGIQRREHADSHNSQTTVAHGTAMLQDQDKRTAQLEGELVKARQDRDSWYNRADELEEKLNTIIRQRDNLLSVVAKITSLIKST